MRVLLDQNLSPKLIWKLADFLPSQANPASTYRVYRVYSLLVGKPWTKVAGERRLAKRTEKAAQLRERRLSRKLTQAAFAKELGVTGNTIARWERCEGPLPHWAVPYLDMQEKIAELTSALAEKDARLRGAIEAQNFELQVEKAMRESLRVTPTADQLHRKLCKTFWQDPTTLVTINEVYLSLTRPSKAIDGELYSVDNEPRPAGA